jgi:hypothetical protein
MEAITLLGFDRVRQLVLMTALVRQFQPVAPGFDPTAFWRHSFAVAVCAGVLAREAAFDEELAFNAGLLHDIGHLFVVIAFPQEFEAILAFMQENDRQRYRGGRARRARRRSWAHRQRHGRSTGTCRTPSSRRSTATTIRMPPTTKPSRISSM